MSDVVGLGRRVSSLDISPQFTNYSKVVIHIDDETAVEVGNDTGRTLELDNPFGTQQMAQDILNKLSGYQYQPYSADGALLDPAAEIGDAANIRGSYGGIYTRSRTFGRLMKADISAPTDEEINHEYKFETPEKREFARQIDDVKASLIIANNRIDAKVEQNGGNNSSFGWTLTATGHKWFSGNKEVMSVTASGLKVTGEVQATSGKIGNFNIGASAIWNNISSFGGNQSSGVYVGTNGIQLGQRFKVDSSGNVTATNMKLTGTLTVGSTTITADNLRLGAERANGGYSSWNGTTSTVNNSGSYWSGGASFGYGYGNAINRNSGSYPSFFRATVIYASGSLQTNAFQYGTQWMTPKTATIAGTTIHYLGY